MSPPNARPSASEIARARLLFAPARALFSPIFHDLHKAPSSGPRLFVGNHTMSGALDVPHLFWELHDQHDIWLRALGDHAHFNVPLWGQLLTRWGVVDGTRDNCARLLDAGEAVLVFPGGAREVVKRRGEAYELIWKQRTGFARMAIAHGATVVPFAALGGDDAWDIVMDTEEVLDTPAGEVIRRMCASVGLGKDTVPPLLRGFAGTPLPKPVRLYFSVGDPIPSTPWAGKADDEAACWALRGRAKRSIQQQLTALRRIREADPHATFARRATRGVLDRFGHLLVPAHKR
jgi:1-acyl-sn-glycerol-3-phosphate acyltransferase